MSDTVKDSAERITKKMVLFDLDGTLLPMDQDEFVKSYFGRLAQKMIPRGYEPHQLVDAIWTGTKAMVANDGRLTNEEMFWKTFLKIYPDRKRDEEEIAFMGYYLNEFNEAKSVCGFEPQAKEIVDLCHEWGLRTALATNPVFPAVATGERIAWAGLDQNDFEFITTYENCCFCKPNPAYFAELCVKLGVKPQECIMVGNDASEDLAALRTGATVFLVTDHLINTGGVSLDLIPHGTFDDLKEWLSQYRITE